VLPGHGSSETVSNIRKDNLFIKEHLHDWTG
jgi:hypothetical protein